MTLGLKAFTVAIWFSYFGREFQWCESIHKIARGPARARTTTSAVPHFVPGGVVFFCSQNVIRQNPQSSFPCILNEAVILHPPRMCASILCTHNSDRYQRKIALVVADMGVVDQ